MNLIIICNFGPGFSAEICGCVAAWMALEAIL
jgi:hypothetical protein